MTWLFRVLSAADAARAEIAIYDVIGKDFFGDGVGQADVLASLQARPKTPVLVRIASIGGILDEAKVMRSLFAERIADGFAVEMRVESLAASAAAYLLTTPGATVTIAEDAFVMIHKARSRMSGTDADMEFARQRLAAANQVLADGFAAASSARGKGKSATDFLAEMANNRDRYFSADEAIAWGLADSKIGAMKIAACAVDLTELADVPAAIAAQFAPRQQELPLNPPPPAGGKEPGQAGKETNNMDLKILAKMLGLAETATEAQVTAELNKRLEPAQPAVAVSGVKLVGVATEAEATAKITGFQRSILALLGTTGKANAEEALATVETWKESAGQVPVLTKKVGELTEEARLAKRDAAIEKAGRDNLPPARHEWAKTQFATAEQVESFCAGLPKGFFQGVNEPGDGDVVSLTDSEKLVCKNLGMTEAQYLEEKKLLRKAG